MALDNPAQYPFHRVTVEHSPLGGTYVLWELDPRFVDPLPHTFQLKYGASDIDDDSAWEDVGPPTSNTSFLVDDEQRVFGSTLEGGYRVAMTAGGGQRYDSGPITVEQGAADWMAWRLAQEMVRSEIVRLGLMFDPDRPNLLLQAKRSGPPCPRCVNPLQGGATNPNCPRCYGVGVDGGYYDPVPVACLIEHGEATETVHGSAPNATTKNDIALARFAGLPTPRDRDIVIERGTRRRWYVGEAAGRSELASHVVAINRKLSLAPYKDSAYLVPLLEGQ